MRAYNLIPKEVEFSFGTLSVLTLGEAGRGRKLTYVPCERRFEDGEPVELIASRAGKPKIVAGTDCSGGWIARISTEGSYMRGAYGHVRVRAQDRALASVVALGYGAFGNAGRVGVWGDYLLTIQPGVVLKVKPTRRPAYFLHVMPDQIVRLEKEEATVYDGADIPVEGEDWVDILTPEVVKALP